MPSKSVFIDRKNWSSLFFFFCSHLAVRRRIYGLDYCHAYAYDYFELTLHLLREHSGHPTFRKAQCMPCVRREEHASSTSSLFDCDGPASSSYASEAARALGRLELDILLL